MAAVYRRPAEASPPRPTKPSRKSSRAAWSDSRLNGKVACRAGSGNPSKYHYFNEREQSRYDFVRTKPRKVTPISLDEQRASWAARRGKHDYYLALAEKHATDAAERADLIKWLIPALLLPLPTTSNNMTNVTKLQPPYDPFDIENLRLDQAFASTAGVKKLLTTVPVRKPHRQELVRVHPDEAYRVQAAVIELRDDREIYLVVGPVASQLPGETTPVILYTTITRQGVVLLWPAKLPGADGKINEWHRSAREAAERAMSSWLFVRADTALGAYTMHIATATIPDPVWPTESFKELLKIGFRDRLIENADHPVLQRLRGES